MRNSSAATVIPGRYIHHIDHLVPLSIGLNIPIVVSDKEIALLIKQFYPPIDLIHIHIINIPKFLLCSYKMIITCLPNPLIRRMMFLEEISTKKTIKNIWCPHGNSDKGYSCKLIEALHQERYAIAYGKQMVKLFKEKNLKNFKHIFIVGNYRKQHYLKHKSFYQRKIPSIFFSKGKTNILYAPTWEDSEGSSSFEKMIYSLIKAVPDNCNLIVKIHPNQLESENIGDAFLSKINHRSNVFFIENTPLIYPLLDHSDIYLGDMSSIGYDFLSFKRPMFFFNVKDRDQKKDKGLKLTKCGLLIKQGNLQALKAIFSYPKSEEFDKIQKGTYDEAFSLNANLDELNRFLGHNNEA